MPAIADDPSRCARARVRLLTCDVDGVLTDGTHLRRRRRQGDRRRSRRSTAWASRCLRAPASPSRWITGSKRARRRASRARARRRARDPGRDGQARRRGARCAPSSACRRRLRAHRRRPARPPAARRCGLAVSVPHAPRAVRDRAHYVTSRDGGAGAVRELCELILAAQDALERRSSRRSAARLTRHGPARAHSSIGSSHGRPCCCWAASPRSPTGSTRRCRRPPRAATARAGTIPTCSSRTSARSASTPNGKLRQSLAAKRAEHYPDDESVDFTAPALALTEPGRPRMSVTADTANVVGRSRDTSLPRQRARDARRADEGRAPATEPKPGRSR